MKAAIMQPYFFPYIGYWQLINAVDVFVVFDDVNYIKRGWINRNRILSDKLKYFNLPLLGVSQNKKINEIMIDREKLMSGRNSRILHETYRKAPYYNMIASLADQWLYINRDNLAGYLSEQIKLICTALGIKTEILISSGIDKPDDFKGGDKIICICKELGADEYINPIGGMSLYDRSDFEKNGIKLSFLKSDPAPYKQFTDNFVPSLSILDQLMFLGIDGTKKKLTEYEI